MTLSAECELQARRAGPRPADHKFKIAESRPATITTNNSLPMTTRRVDDIDDKDDNDAIAADDVLEHEVRSMRVKSMKSELASRGVSLLGFVEKNDLIDALLHARRRDVAVGRATTMSSGDLSAGAASAVPPLPSSLREFARQFEDADAPDLARDAISLFEAAWEGIVAKNDDKHVDDYDDGEKKRRGPPSSWQLAMAIKRGSTKLDNLMSDYIKTVPAEITAMVGDDAFDASKFTSDALDAFRALRDLDFAELGTIHYEHIYSALDREGDDWYGRSKFVHDDSIDVRAIAKFCRDVVHLTETLRKLIGRRIAIDDAEGVVKLNESRMAGLAFEEKDAEDGNDDPSSTTAAVASARRVIVRTSGVDRGTRLIIHRDAAMSYLPNDAISLAYLRAENLVPPAVKDGPPLVYSGGAHAVEMPSFKIKWVQLFGTTSDDNPLLTPRMAARIHSLVSLATEDELRDYYTDGCIPIYLPEEALPFFRRSAEWRDDYYQCHARIGMRLQGGLLPKPDCYGENVALRNVMRKMRDHYDGDDDVPVFCEYLPAFPNDNNYEIVEGILCNDKKTLKSYRHPSMWFHAFEYPGQSEIKSFFAPRNDGRSKA